MSFRESITVDCDCCGREFVRSADGIIGTPRPACPTRTKVAS